MNNLLINIFFVSSIIGILIGLALISKVFTERKSNFFIGLVVLIFAFELLFSWASHSGYNSTPGAFPISILLNYLIIPPSIWLFVKFNTDDNFRLSSWHYLLFIPAVIHYLLEILSFFGLLKLGGNLWWFWFSELLPLIGLIYVIPHFWITYWKLNRLSAFKSQHKFFLAQVKLLMLMGSLTLIFLFWLTFSFIGWKYFEFIEYSIVFLFFGFAFLNFLDNETFPTVTLEDKNQGFPLYDDQKSLTILEQTLKEQKLFLKPNLSLKELSVALNLPVRYVSFLINHYHHKNYKEFINQFRINAFLEKAESGEKDRKTLLALALESGFSSKSTFNQVFKNQLGKSPSEYLG